VDPELGGLRAHGDREVGANNGLEGSSHRHGSRGRLWVVLRSGVDIQIGIARFGRLLLGHFDRDPDAVAAIERIRP